VIPRGLPNVPLLSCGRIRKQRACRWRRASPWYFTTGDRHDAEASHDARPSASTACWPAPRRSRELAVALSFWRAARLDRCCQHGSHRERARKEPAPRGVGLAPPRPEARSLGGRANLSRPGLLALPNTEARNTQRATRPKPVARPSPWYFTTGSSNKLNSRPARLALHAGRPKSRRLVLETSGTRTKRRALTARRPMRCSCQSKTPANPDHASRPDLVELNRRR
jgi:hypothetical protein